MSLRQDYILRLIDELRQFVSAMLEGGGTPGRMEEALLAVLHAQRQLFQRQPAEFMGLSLDAQLDLLVQGESPADAVEKVRTYALILEQAARIYDGGHRSALAANSRQLALCALLSAVQRWPVQRAGLCSAVESLRGQIQGTNLNPTVRELLSAYDATTGSCC
jgi:hypothetical protein